MAQHAVKVQLEAGDLPGWVPEAARHYLAHVEGGVPIRELARRSGVHASTVLRQVRRVEARRDDPLVDGALRRLAARPDGPAETRDRSAAEEEEARIEADLLRVLRRLCEAGATLAVAREMDRAVVVRDGPDGEPARTAMVERPVAEVMALRELVETATPEARIARYRVTAAGRAELRLLVAARENAARDRVMAGFAEARERFRGPGEGARPLRMTLAESPLAGLARRRDREGTPFLDRALVAAGERLREDFELAQLEGEMPDWTGVVSGETVVPLRGKAPGPALERVAAALADLGPGLGDVALRCCCLMEGLEEAERRMGWSARSGKIVLRIALQRLRQHYDALPSPRIG